MNKRAVSAALWFYSMWYAGDMLGSFLGLPQVFGPLVGAASAALFVRDPWRVIWSNATRQAEAG
jgi:hypothetical protein